ncbi:MAG: polysaccharide deacetylase family protein [Pseudomonadota bacterium]
MIKHVLVTALLLASLAHADESGARKIALSFDDAPLGDGAFYTGDERTLALIDALQRAGVESAMFFATAGNLERAGDAGVTRLERYAAAGHLIANHSHGHRSANRTPAADFLADVDRANRALSGLPGFAPYFRFPFLHEGRPAARRDAIRDGLEERGLGNGYVTVDNYDWYLQVLADEVVAAGGRIDTDAWRDAYVETLTDAVEFYDALASRSIGRSPHHVLLLHENDLAALFVDDLVTALRADGWDIVSAETAYDDAISTREPDTLFLNQGRVAAIAHVQGAAPRRLVSTYEDEAVLRAEFLRRGLIDPGENAYLSASPPGNEPTVFAPGKVSRSDAYEYGSVFSASGTEAFFGVDVGERAEIRTTRLEDGEWKTPEVVLADPVFTYGDPFLSLDGSRLYFISNRPREGGFEPADFDIWYVDRRQDGWSEPVNLGAPINTPANEYYVSLTDDGHLAFASNRGAGGQRNFDVYVAAPKDDGGYYPPQRLPDSVNSPAYEADPFIAHDGSYLIFGATRRDGSGRGDLYISFKDEEGEWSEAVSMGPRINTQHHELCPYVSRDGRYLFYTSNEDIRWLDAAVIDELRQEP